MWKSFLKLLRGHANQNAFVEMNQSQIEALSASGQAFPPYVRARQNNHYTYGYEPEVNLKNIYAPGTTFMVQNINASFENVHALDIRAEYKKQAGEILVKDSNVALLDVIGAKMCEVDHVLGLRTIKANNVRTLKINTASSLEELNISDINTMRRCSVKDAPLLKSSESVEILRSKGPVSCVVLKQNDLYLAEEFKGSLQEISEDMEYKIKDVGNILSKYKDSEEMTDYQLNLFPMMAFIKLLNAQPK